MVMGWWDGQARWDEGEVILDKGRQKQSVYTQLMFISYNLSHHHIKAALINILLLTMTNGKINTHVKKTKIVHLKLKFVISNE